MLKISFKKFFLYSAIVIFIFILDRISKLYILNLVEINNEVDIYIFSFLKLYLIWNKGVAFGLFSFEQNSFYNFITILIIIINLVILIMITKLNDIRAYFLMFILGGSSGNLFDRIYYSAVPDFIDFHINDFHWFIFNAADVFISVGVICLIIVEFIFNKTSKK
jgi:lipoprotein signal peptidase